MREQGTDYVGYIYAGMLALGGLMGFRRRRSLISLIMGTLSGILAGYGAYKVSNDGHDVYVGLAVSWGLCAIMGYRAVVTEKFMPAGLVMVVSLLVGTYYALLVKGPPEGQTWPEWVSDDL